MPEKRQTSQGYIIRILQHFATKLRNITNFVMLFQAVMKFLTDLSRSKFHLKGERSIARYIITITSTYTQSKAVLFPYSLLINIKGLGGWVGYSSYVEQQQKYAQLTCNTLISSGPQQCVRKHFPLLSCLSQRKITHKSYSLVQIIVKLSYLGLVLFFCILEQ
jgi:hypothetical protein